MALQWKVESFDKHLKDEAVLSNNYNSEKAKLERQMNSGGAKWFEETDDVFELNTHNPNFEDELLVDD